MLVPSSWFPLILYTSQPCVCLLLAKFRMWTAFSLVHVQIMSASMRFLWLLNVAVYYFEKSTFPSTTHRHSENKRYFWKIISFWRFGNSANKQTANSGKVPSQKTHSLSNFGVMHSLFSELLLIFYERYWKGNKKEWTKNKGQTSGRCGQKTAPWRHR